MSKKKNSFNHFFFISLRRSSIPRDFCFIGGFVTGDFLLGPAKLEDIFADIFLSLEVFLESSLRKIRLLRIESILIGNIDINKCRREYFL